MKEQEQKLPAMTKDKLGWLAMFLLSKPHGVRFEEIQEQWAKNDIFQKRKPLQYRTFHNWCLSIRSMGRFYVEHQASDHKYFLRRFEEKDESVQEFRLISYSLTDYQKIDRALQNMLISDRIVQEPSFDCEEILDIISTAMRENRVLLIDYDKFGNEEGYEMEVHPYALRYCQRRWYLLAYSPERQGLRTYALDRLPGCAILDKTFEYPKDFDAKEYYKDCVGVFKGISEEEKEPCLVLLKATKRQADYLQTLPLHKSQRIMLEDINYSLFSYKVLPTDEFANRILAMGDEVEVMEPAFLRDKIKSKLENMIKCYSKN